MSAVRKKPNIPARNKRMTYSLFLFDSMTGHDLIVFIVCQALTAAH